VLLPEWSLDRESVIPDVGFSEGAADALFASMVQLDLALGGKVGEYENNQLKRLYDSQGKLIRKQGDLFNSPLHFMGFSRGTVVNSEILQRLGTFFPQAGGTSMADRDLQMTTIDPHDFYQPSLNLRLPGFFSTNFSDFYEPKIQVWNNVTFADNYYQTVADPNSGTATPNGRALGLLPQEELDKNPQPAGLNFPKVNGDALGQADREILLGTREVEPGSEYSRIGFTKDDGIGGTHTRAFGWYAGTVDLSLEQVKVEYPHVEASENPQEINDILGEKGNSELSDPNKRAANDWYDNANGEGVNEGWFFSVLGGGKEERQYSLTGRVPVSFDNTLSAGMRGDYAVPTLFNGNFDQFIPNKSQPETLGRNTISKEIPGWSFHGATSTLVSPINNLVEWTQIAQQSPNFLNNLESLGINSTAPNYQPNFALKLDGGDSITHNRFVVPDWGALRFDVHVPTPARLNDKDDFIQVYLETDDRSYLLQSQEIPSEAIPPVAAGEEINSILPAVDLREVHPSSFSNSEFGLAVPPQWMQSQLNRIGFGSHGFETFQVNIPDELRGKTAKLSFKLNGDTPAYIDNIFFQSKHLNFGNPALNQQEARRDEKVSYPNNYLIENPQFAASYNESLKTPNWVSYQLNQSWINGPDGSIQRQESGANFVEDLSIPSDSLTRVDGEINYDRFQRGHMTRAEDRSRLMESFYPDSQTGSPYKIYKDYKLTYLMTNILPQFIVTQGRDPWGGLETYLTETLVQQQNKELFIIAGRDGQRSIFNSGGINISAPSHTWKVVLVLEPGQGVSDVTKNTIAFAVDIPNYSSTERVSPDNPGSPLFSGNWRDYVTSIHDLEAVTGYKFLSNIPSDIQEWIKGNNNPDSPRSPAISP
jgi:DNA/RNA endonuclease G (NUC1)